MIVLTDAERAALAEWYKMHTTQMYTSMTADKAIAPVLERILSLPSEPTYPDPYAGKRTVISGEDCIGGKRDQGITRKSER